MQTSITFDKLLTKYHDQHPDVAKAFAPKGTFSGVKFLFTPPYFQVQFEDSKKNFELDLNKLMDIFQKHLNGDFPKENIELESDFYYIVKFQEEFMLAKNANDDAIIFYGKFTVGEIVVVTCVTNYSTKKSKLWANLVKIHGLVNQKLTKKEKEKDKEK